MSSAQAVVSSRVHVALSVSVLPLPSFLHSNFAKHNHVTKFRSEKNADRGRTPHRCSLGVSWLLPVCGRQRPRAGGCRGRRTPVDSPCCRSGTPRGACIVSWCRERWCGVQSCGARSKSLLAAWRASGIGRWRRRFGNQYGGADIGPCPRWRWRVEVARESEEHGISSWQARTGSHSPHSSKRAAPPVLRLAAVPPVPFAHHLSRKLASASTLTPHSRIKAARSHNPRFRFAPPPSPTATASPS